ncbi:flagellar hook capping FlgD N-terminal domain-containing protein [Vogesella indigofera]|uniref:flagellar hook capping FlgD N-terminal domain-containing protein n=1 Tax=Vogesella indigofera TaxID=45465 RepID=UPI00234EE00F|nr:flagellar hook capping FlgD N-terminal domain-containing protein [Vogesella indigofera]MDC7700671.1 flagellar hook capping FlgD N-terminal domain-containing protein [Vogesella indigofera]MDC7706119.1 flagellar hook capping FlgD N-terminal domain-containing protein [Vogesella indigofera]
MAIDASALNQRSQNGGSTQASAVAGQQLGADSDMFMTLLMAQIKNQNPLEPTDPAQFVGQLVQMNQMQSTLGMLSELKSNALMMRELQGLALGEQVGKQVLVQSDRLQLDGKPVGGRITLDGSDEVQLQLTGADGSSKLITLGRQAAGEFAFTLDPAAHGLPAGQYQAQVVTAAKSAARLEFAAEVQAVRLPVQGGEPILSLAGLGEYPASSITRLLGAASSTSSTRS